MLSAESLAVLNKEIKGILDNFDVKFCKYVPLLAHIMADTITQLFEYRSMCACYINAKNNDLKNNINDGSYAKRLGYKVPDFCSWNAIIQRIQQGRPFNATYLKRYFKTMEKETEGNGYPYISSDTVITGIFKRNKRHELEKLCDTILRIDNLSLNITKETDFSELYVAANIVNFLALNEIHKSMGYFYVDLDLVVQAVDEYLSQETEKWDIMYYFDKYNFDVYDEAC